MLLLLSALGSNLYSQTWGSETSTVFNQDFTSTGASNVCLGGSSFGMTTTTNPPTAWPKTFGVAFADMAANNMPFSGVCLKNPLGNAVSAFNIGSPPTSADASKYLYTTITTKSQRIQLTKITVSDTNDDYKGGSNSIDDAAGTVVLWDGTTSTTLGTFNTTRSNTNNTITISPAITLNANSTYQLRFQLYNGVGATTQLVMDNPAIFFKAETVVLPNKTLCIGDTSTLDASSVTGIGTVSYKWYKAASTTPSPATDTQVGTASTYTIPTASAGTSYYYVVITDSNGSTTSSVSTVTVADCTDTDGDGIVDSIDLDDDNDGILDCVENGLNDVSNSFELNGTATRINASEVRLTQASNNQSGQMWSNGSADFTKDFKMSLIANLGNKVSDGADGIAIVFQNDPAGIFAKGIDGRGLGAYTIKKGLALELDTYNNGSADFPTGNDEDPNDTHGQIWTTETYGPLTTATSITQNGSGLKASGDWNVEVNWNASNNTISYRVKQVSQSTWITVGSAIINPMTIFGTNTPKFGFTSSTGGFSNVQSVKFANLCTDLALVLDTDGDGIPNHLDTDSDNDGCPDAIEGGDNVTSTQVNPYPSTNITAPQGSINTKLDGTSNGTVAVVDANGVPVLVNAAPYTNSTNTGTAGTAGVANVTQNQGQTVGNSTNGNVSDCATSCNAKFGTWSSTGSSPNFTTTTTVAGNVMTLKTTNNTFQSWGDISSYTPPTPNGDAGLLYVANPAAGKPAVNIVENSNATAFVYNITFAAATTEILYLHVTDMNGSKTSFNTGKIVWATNGSGIGTTTYIQNGPLPTNNLGGLTLEIPVGTTSFTMTKQNDNSGDGFYIMLSSACSAACYKDPSTQANPLLPSKHGVTLLKRAGADNGNWPMLRQSAHTVLESNSKGFVVTRMSTVDIEGQTTPTVIASKITNPIVGMMVYDTTAQCLKIYTGSGTGEGWKCFSNPGCPD